MQLLCSGGTCGVVTGGGGGATGPALATGGGGALAARVAVGEALRRVAEALGDALPEAPADGLGLALALGLALGLGSGEPLSVAVAVTAAGAASAPGCRSAFLAQPASGAVRATAAARARAVRVLRSTGMCAVPPCVVAVLRTRSGRPRLRKALIVLLSGTRQLAQFRCALAVS
ncbi:hypothetical protein GCM10023235_29640 [Kitasatospora terrestris]|uniref:Uncharacterized protein n=1 Tax=Kitasatospora terrestris TaxID=258051 RepID=A0ABP9DMY7_9ACTN